MADEPYVYVASSWRNRRYPGILDCLEQWGIKYHDFRDEAGAFSWSDIDPTHSPGWEGDVRIEELLVMLNHPVAEQGFRRDFEAIKSCFALLVVQPAGISAHLELGYAAGLGKPTCVLFDTRHPQRPELMVKVADLLTTDVEEALRFLDNKRMAEFRRLDLEKREHFGYGGP